MKRVCGFFILLVSLTVVICMNTLQAQIHKMYVGTYTSESESKGVYVYDFDEKSGDAKLVKTIEMSNPSFLARKGNVLYAVNEDTDGMLTAYDLSQDKVISQVTTKGMHPCHISLSPKFPIAVVSNYSSGSLCIYSLNADGGINAMDDFLEFKGSSIDKSRQNESHIHSAFFSKDGARVYVSDLGADLIYVFEIDTKDGKFKFRKVQDIKTKLGGGPRHLVFSKDEKTLYSIMEMTGEVQVFQRENDSWVSKQLVPMYPEGFSGEHGGADIKLSKNGKELFATNRGTAHFVFKYTVGKNGLLKVSSHSSVMGDSPRNLNISPKGKYILISNQITQNISVFGAKLDSNLNLLQKLNIPKPVCVIF